MKSVWGGGELGDISAKPKIFLGVISVLKGELWLLQVRPSWSKLSPVMILSRQVTFWTTIGKLPNTKAPVLDLGIISNSRRLAY